MKLALLSPILCTAACLPPASPAATAGAAGPTAAPGGGFDVSYAVPEGFAEARGDQAITLAYATSDGYSNTSYTLVILPSQAPRGTLAETFLAMWDELVTPLFTPAYSPGLRPAPLRRRLASGYAVAFDGELMNANQGGMFTTVLYVLSSGDRVVPVLGMYGDLDARKGEPIVEAFFESLAIAGHPPSGTPLFDASELVGEWSTHATELANRVDTSGRYAGDATIAVRQDHTFGADGTYAAYASAYQGDRGFDREASAGAWRVDDDAVVIETSAGTKRYRVLAVGHDRGGAAIYLPPSYASESAAELTRPRSLGDWFGKVR